SIGYKTRTCSLCRNMEYSFTEAVGHKYDNGTVLKEVTCAGDGIKLYSCLNCGITKTQIINAIDHVYVDGKCIFCDKLEGSKDLIYTLNSY
ncbi:MAG: hypothetical protein K2N03_08440, partial [Muribaculaceae bacterium]|nr:hypothetical protein [Muribaculaceae bacterium]